MGRLQVFLRVVESITASGTLREWTGGRPRPVDASLDLESSTCGRGMERSPHKISESYSFKTQISEINCRQTFCRQIICVLASITASGTLRDWTGGRPRPVDASLDLGSSACERGMERSPLKNHSNPALSDKNNPDQRN